MTLLIREKPPLRLAASVRTPNGNSYRWAADEHSGEKAGSGLTCSSTMPGGFEQASISLPRKPRFDYDDLTELSTVTIRGPGASWPAFEGRLETSPRSSGSQLMISPGLTGWQAHLQDDNSARMIYVGAALTDWLDATVARQIKELQAGVDLEQGSVAADPATGAPALMNQLTGAWARSRRSEMWYDARGIKIAALYYAWKTPSDYSGDANWDWRANLDTDDTDTGAWDTSGELRAPGPGSGLVTATGDRYWASVHSSYGGAGGNNGQTYPLYWTSLVVIGNHGLPTYGTPPGVLCSDVEAHAIGAWAPKLRFTTGANGTIRPSSFAIPHLLFLDPGTVSGILQAATAYELRDWAVWEGPTYYSNPLNGRGRKWRARVSPANLQDAGPQIDRLWNGVIVTYTDVGGITRSVGPPGSDCNTADASLQDSDPLNPANEAGIRRWAALQMGTSTPAGAIQVGAMFLSQQRLLNTAGSATISGFVESDNGTIYPAWAIRAGDQISFVDAHDPGYRRIVNASYDESSSTNTLQLDQPPDGMQALLARLSVVLTPLGFS